ncbi:MAG: hypothetical protein JXA69_14555 [Phycisphaerae bacterium]|nr:hypothetical protein [Phycisphaerae bacterium]
MQPNGSELLMVSPRQTQANKDRATACTFAGNAASSSASWAMRLAVAIPLLAALGALIMPRAWIIAMCSDDAFYYFTIARNIVEGRGCTFDGVAPTNGFHPLYMLICTGIFYLAGSDPDLPIRLILSLNFLFALLSVYITIRLVNSYLAPGWGWLAGLLFAFPPLFGAMTNGMETGLMVACTSVLVYLCCVYRIHRPSSGMLGGLVFGLGVSVVTLARLDSAFLLPAAACLVMLRILREPGQAGCVLRHGLGMAVGFLPLFGAFVLWNLSYFGMIMPISGQVKSAAPSLGRMLELTDNKSLGLLLLMTIGLCLLLTGLLRRHAHGRVALLSESSLPVLGLACLFHYAYIAMCVSWGAYWWHFSLYGLVLVLLIPQVVFLLTSALPSVRRPFAAACVIAFVGFGCLNGLRIFYVGQKHASWLAAAQWIRDELPADAVIGMKDAGLVGYYSFRQVVNLDGKANERAYWTSVLEGNPDEYLKTRGVDYIAEVSACYHGDIAYMRIPRPQQPALLYQMQRKNEVYRSRPYHAPPAALNIAVPGLLTIWQYDGSLQLSS